MLLQLDFASETPIYLQIRNQVVQGIAGGALRPGERLPTIRALADESGINMMTVNKAYQLLKQEGYICADRRSGAVVNGARRQTHALDARCVEELRQIASEAKLQGVSAEEFAAAAEAIYRELEVSAP